MQAAIRISGLAKRYGEGETAVDALRDVDMTVAPGEVVGLVGPSGSGKTTLLKCLGAVIEPTAGTMHLGGERIYDHSGGGWQIGDLRALRRDRIGFIFQAPYLIPFLDVTDNVALLPMLAGKSNAEARGRAQELIEALDVGHRVGVRVSMLSGGYPDPVSNAEQLSFLFFFYLVEGIDAENKMKAKVLKQPYDSLFVGEWTIKNPQIGRAHV